MASQIMFLKVACQWHSWQLTWIRMVQSIRYRLKMHISMAATPDVQAIKLWHCLYITRPCIVYLGLQPMEVKSESTKEISLFLGIIQ